MLLLASISKSGHARHEGTARQRALRDCIVVDATSLPNFPVSLTKRTCMKHDHARQSTFSYRCWAQMRGMDRTPYRLSSSEAHARLFLMQLHDKTR